MSQAAFYMLRSARTEVEHIDRPDTPRIVVFALPIKHAILPIPPTGIPPFTSDIVFLLGISVQHGGIAVGSCIPIHIVRGKRIIDNFTQRDAAYYHYRVDSIQSAWVFGISSSHPTA